LQIKVASKIIVNIQNNMIVQKERKNRKRERREKKREKREM